MPGDRGLDIGIAFPSFRKVDDFRSDGLFDAIVTVADPQGPRGRAPKTGRLAARRLEHVVDRIRGQIVQGHAALHLCLRDGHGASRCAACTRRSTYATAQEVAGL